MATTNRPPQPSDPVPGCLAPLATVQARAHSFFASFENRHRSKMGCRRGCSACCFATFSIFSAEAELIMHWARNLSPSKAHALAQTLRERMTQDAQGTTAPGTTPTGTLSLPCVFLTNNDCAIYPARPTLCRTQGVPLLLRSRRQEESTASPASSSHNETEAELDVCPKHPGYADERWPDWKEALDLERLNTLLALAQGAFEKGTGGQSCAPMSQAEHEPVQPRGPSRIALGAVREELVRLCEATALEATPPLGSG